MDPASAEFLLALADSLYNDALACDKAGLSEMCTANLELTMQLQLSLIVAAADPLD